MNWKSIILMAQLVGTLSCQLQKNKNMETNNNPLLCDPAKGVCEMPDTNTAHPTALPKIEKSLKIIYFTDPICSSCWGIEPQLRKLKLEYGNAIEIEYRMGGLLPDWSYNSGGISKPSDVAHHWDEVSRYYDMPIDGDIWLEDPLPSSYPPSIAFKAAQLQSEEKALLFLREIREQVFLQKKNITKWEHLESAATKTGLNVDQLKSDYNNQAKALFEEDLTLAKSLGVRGFPTMFLVNQSNNKEMVYGAKPYSFYEAAILKLNPEVTKINYDKNWESLFSSYSSLTANEFAQLSGVARMESEKLLNDLVAKGQLEILKTKNGSLWRLKKK